MLWVFPHLNIITKTNCPLEEICLLFGSAISSGNSQVLLYKLKKLIYKNMDGKQVSSWKPALINCYNCLRICAEMNCSPFPPSRKMPWSNDATGGMGWSSIVNYDSTVLLSYIHVPLSVLSPINEWLSTFLFSSFPSVGTLLWVLFLSLV